MADDAKDVEVKEITPEDLDSDEQDTTKAEPSPAKEEKPAKVEKLKAESKEPEVAKDTKEKEVEKATPPDIPVKDTETEDQKVEETETEEKPQGQAEERKVQLNTEIRNLVAQRNAIRDEVTKQNAETYQPATEEELTEQGMTDLEAKVEAMRQQNDMDKYNSQVADAQLTLSSESEQVLRDFPMFDSGRDSYDEELSTEAAELLQANLITDPNSGQIIGSNVLPYQLYKTLAKASGISATKGQMKGQAATEQMLANADAGAGASPPKKVVDPVITLWEEDD